jgi:metal-responsive CopG/Arc/MetJ family transcriptional regulator
MQSSRPGRKLELSAEDRRPRGVRVSVSLDEELIKMLEQIRRDLSEPSFSGLVRRLLKERLGELGILNEDARKALGLTRLKNSEHV